LTAAPGETHKANLAGNAHGKELRERCAKLTASLHPQILCIYIYAMPVRAPVRVFLRLKYIYAKAKAKVRKIRVDK